LGFRADLHRWRQLVSPAWLAGLLAQTPIVAAPANDWRLLEIGFGGLDAFLDGHIAGAAYIDTLQLERAPLWNKVTDRALLALLLSHGIRHDTTVVLYGRNSLAAARAAHLMLYAGVADVRLLDGGYDAWRAQAFPIERGTARQYPAASDFGIQVPAHPEYLIDMRQARQLLEQGNGALVSVRTWDEYVGKTSGYSYIEAKGDIPGARWGRARNDDDVNHMSEFHGPDGLMISAAEIRGIWDETDIRPGKPTAFYCGTGWRASLAFFYAWLMNWEYISVYDGGWCEWSRDPDNPVVCRVASPAW
jgi:3-mercaptopyruvate sulfurtransferase SseA